MNALLLLSGGMDSTLCLHLNQSQIKLCVGFDYGQQHIIELDYAESIARSYKKQFLKHKLNKIPLIDNVVFAGRNLLLISNGIALALENGLDEVIIGVNKTDSLRFPDCSNEFIGYVNKIAGMYGVAVSAPLLQCTKKEIIKQSLVLPKTWTCYSPVGNTPCNKCFACKLLT